MNDSLHRRFLKALLLGIAGSFFFAFTFVLNRSMNLAGGHWLWSASLRYFFTLPILLLLCRKSIFPAVRLPAEPIRQEKWDSAVE